MWTLSGIRDERRLLCRVFPEWENLDDKIGWYWEYILLSDTELVIPEARSGMYKMEKVEEYIEPNNEIDSLSVCKYYGLHYGTWEITKQLGNPCQYVSIGDRLEIRKKKKLIDFCRVLNRKVKSVDEIAKQIGLNDNNNYLIYCRFTENHFWEYMLIQDGMNAIIVKGDYWYQVHRISDPEKDGIYNEL